MASRPENAPLRASIDEGTLGRMRGSDDVDAYLAGVPEQTRLALQELRETIKPCPRCPGTDQLGSRLHFPTRLLGWLGGKGGVVGFSPRGRPIALLRDELGEFDPSGGTVHFSPEHRLPKALVRSIVAIRLADNLGA